MIKELKILTSRNLEEEKGLGILEVIFSIVIISLVMASMTKNMMIAMKIFKQRDVSEAAFDLAVDRVEHLSVQNAVELSDSNDEVESNLTSATLSSNMKFTRTTNITVNADNSRTVDVTVTSNSSKYPVTKNYSIVMAVWE